MGQKEDISKALQDVLELIVVKKRQRVSWEGQFLVVPLIYEEGYSYGQGLRPACRDRFDFENEDEVKGFIRGLELMADTHYVFFEREENTDAVRWRLRKEGHFSSHCVHCRLSPEEDVAVLLRLADQFGSGNKIPSIWSVRFV